MNSLLEEQDILIRHGVHSIGPLSCEGEARCRKNEKREFFFAHASLVQWYSAALLCICLAAALRYAAAGLPQRTSAAASAAGCGGTEGAVH